MTLRAAIVASAAIGAFALLASLLAYAVVGGSLRSTLAASLRADADGVAALYRLGESGSARDALAGPTGGVIVHLYDPFAMLLAASSDRMPPLPREVVLGAVTEPADWRGALGEGRVMVALTPFAFGVVAVIGDTAFVAAASTRVARTLAAASLAFVVASAVAGSLLARVVVEPVRALAAEAQRRDADRLDPLPDPVGHDEVAQLTRVLNDLLARLRAALDAQRTLLAETSHELRTPLTALQGFLARAARRAPEGVHGDLADAQRLAASMTRLLGDLLALSRGAVARDFDPHLLDPYVDVAVPVASEFGLPVAGGAGVWVIGDPERLRQLLRNLLSNAVRAAGVEGVAVALTAGAADVTIAVTDRGPGIPDALRERVFEKFFSGAGGTGLGLAIARQIARAHGSDLTLVSAPGSTTFAFTLARASVDDV